MRRRPTIILLLICALGSLLLSAELPEKWRSWRYSRFIQTALQNDTSTVQLELPWDMYAHCQPGCEDVRIVNSRGEEVPFVLQERHQQTNSTSLAARLVENSFVPDRYTQVIGDLGADHPAYDRIQVGTSRPDFLVWAEVAFSDDAKIWRVVESRAPIARFRSRGIDGTQTIPVQGLSSRYVRVRIADSSAQFPVNGINVLQHGSYKVERKEFPAAFAQQNATDSSESVWRTSLASLNQPLSQLEITTDTPEFYRAVRISGSPDGNEWSYCGSGVIYRYKQNGVTKESLRVEFPENTGNRLVRVEVINGNDQPLTNVGFKLAAVPRTVLFKRTEGQQYRLLYGNEKIGRPQYDLVHYLDSARGGNQTYGIAALLTEEQTANFRDPRPFSERHPEILWSVLGVAILLIGLTALKALRGTGKSAPAE
jgi:hypothetical protein